LLFPLLALGIISLVVWRATDDLRLYGWVVFFPLLVLPLLFWLFPPKYTGTANWFVAAGADGLRLRSPVFAGLIQSHVGCRRARAPTTGGNGSCRGYQRR